MGVGVGVGISSSFVQRTVGYAVENLSPHFCDYILKMVLAISDRILRLSYVIVQKKAVFFSPFRIFPPVSYVIVQKKAVFSPRSESFASVM